MVSNSPKSNNSSQKAITMADLLSSYQPKKIYYNRGDQIEGTVAYITNSDLIVDLGAKTEGVLNLKELPEDKAASLKAGDSITAYVAVSENDSGQIVLTANKASLAKGSPEKLKKWNKFIQTHARNSKLNGRVAENNKGGLVIEIDGIRGFLPISQINFEMLSMIGLEGGFGALVGKDIQVSVIEVEPNSNRLIFSTRFTPDQATLDKLGSYKAGQTVKGRVVLVAPFGVFVNLNDLEGLVFGSEAAWEKVEDLTKLYSVGQEIETRVLGVDKELGRVNLSVKQLSEDPFDKISDKYQTDDVINGTVREINQTGVMIDLGEGLEGFIPSSKVESAQYNVGQSANFLVDEIDKNKRRINLVPFLTSTKGLLYK